MPRIVLEMNEGKTRHCKDIIHHLDNDEDRMSFIFYFSTNNPS